MNDPSGHRDRHRLQISLFSVNANRLYIGTAVEHRFGFVYPAIVEAPFRVDTAHPQRALALAEGRYRANA